MRRRGRFAGFVVAILLTIGLQSTSNAIHRAVAQDASPVGSPTASSEIELTRLVETPGTLTVAELQALPNQTADVTFMAGNGEQSHSYTGALLWDVIDRAKLKLNPDNKNDQLRKYVVLTASDGYEVVISLGEIDPNFGNQPYLLAWEQDGKTLTGEEGPVRLVTPGDVKGGRYVYGVVKIEVREIDSSPRT
jgi:DMSO/TMAO reductase YedYZ molybdopterin-dependent catalytic subunit